LLIANTLASGTETKCHPQCSWKCDDPHCPAICDPVCEPPKCHTSCAEPRNAICDVKCEKPECEIKCPDKGCEMFDCPKCVTVCKAPHCVTHCQAPKPECEAVCEEPKCDWKCHKPNCPKPKCELVCENPNCVPKVECCNCMNGGGMVPSMPFFKETEMNKACCGCGNNKYHPSQRSFPNSHQHSSMVGGTPYYDPVVNNVNRAMLTTLPQSALVDNGSHFLKVQKTASFNLFKSGIPLTAGEYTRTAGHDDEWNRHQQSLNINLQYQDSRIHHQK